MSLRKTGISFKTSLISGIVVLIFLSVSSAIFLKLEANLFHFIIETLMRKIETTIKDQGELRKAEMRERSEIQLRIFNGIAGNALYNFDRDGLRTSLYSYAKFREIEAIEVFDSQGELFLCVYKTPEIVVNTKLPENVSFDMRYMFEAETFHENNKVGRVKIYCTDAHLVRQINQIKDKAVSEISAFNEFIGRQIRKVVWIQISTVICVIVLLILSVSFCLKSVAIKPIMRIAESVRIIASGELDAEVRIGRNDEIGQLASDVDKMRLAIKEMTENLKEQERLKSEMELARKIQMVLLPKNPVISGYEIAASMQPSEEVGGDYYDVISAGGFDWIVMGDVSGHGVTAGLVMMMVQTAIHTVLIQNPEVPPSELLWVINRTIYENIVLMDEQKHMTILVIACGKDGFFDFSGLHEDILLWCAATRKVEKIETDGMWIGLEADISRLLPANEFRMGMGDCIVLYTDGVTEARGKDGKMFGDDRLTKIIESSGGKSAAEIHASVLDALKDYEKPDDVTLFVMKRVNSA